MEHAGYKVVEAATGQEALASAEIQPALIILDIRLPDLSGYDVCQALKSNPETSSIPVLHISASFTDNAHRALGLNLGADGYVTHPIDTNVLLATVRSLLRLHTAEMEARSAADALDVAYREQKRIAESLQKSLLITVPENTYPGLQVASFYEAAWEEASVGGDFYDTFEIPGGKVALVVGDATGKGLAAATRTAEVKFALRAYLYEHGDPASALRLLNQFLCDGSAKSDENAVVALVIGLVDTKAGTVTFTAAGAERPLIAGEDKTIRSIETSGLPLGAFKDADYTNITYDFAVGETIVLATDGITEARRGNEFLSERGMARLAASHVSGPTPLYEGGLAMLDEARDFADGKFQDDVCILVVRRTN